MDGGESGGPIRGRGAAGNPANRFTRLTVLPDPEARDPDDPGPRTHFFRDASRTVIARNDSPDVGFTHSVNPYRGCEHGCVYCVGPETPLLMADGTTRAIAEVRPGDEIYGTARRGVHRRLVRTRVLAHWSTRKPAYRLTLADGTELVASGDHRFLTERGWKFVTGDARGPGRRPFLTTRNRLLGVGAFAAPVPHGAEYRRGYLRGVIRGNGSAGSNGPARGFRLALVDPDSLGRAAAYLRDAGVATPRGRAGDPSGDRPMRAVADSSAGREGAAPSLLAWPESPGAEWSAGFLAGAFDAGGSYADGVLRIAGCDPAVVEQAVLALRRIGFDSVVEAATRAERPVSLRVAGGLLQHLRFLHAVRPAAIRRHGLEGQALQSSARLRVVSVEPLGRRLPLFDITTGTGDFIADGVVSHNCYARPTHEWLGFSAGLDFETRIMVKEDAPELLRRKLLSPGWTPAPIALSGVTDAYQPAERRLRITRRCLEVLAEFRNPVGIVTKGHLVTRDADLLAELAAHGAAMVFLSVTSLDASLQRALEPRASSPERRLDALRRLSAAGVPVGVLVAPCIPGLTDHELPAILAAAAEAGARTAGFIPLRLPHGNAELFERWLEDHFPDRKSRVLGRIREVRGGKLNDPRFGSRMRGEGEYADQLRALFRVTCRRLGMNEERVELSTAAFRRPDPGGQLGLFG